MIRNFLIAASEVAVDVATNGNAPLADRVALGGQMTLLGMGIVFSVLVTLMIVLTLFRIFFYDIPNKKKSAAKEEKAPEAPAAIEPAPAPAAPVVEESDDTAVIAAITAAISVYLEAPTTSFRVVSFKRINKK